MAFLRPRYRSVVYLWYVNQLIQKKNVFVRLPFMVFAVWYEFGATHHILPWRLCSCLQCLRPVDRVIWRWITWFSSTLFQWLISRLIPFSFINFCCCQGCSSRFRAPPGWQPQSTGLIRRDVDFTSILAHKKGDSYQRAYCIGYCWCRRGRRRWRIPSQVEWFYWSQQMTTTPTGYPERHIPLSCSKLVIRTGHFISSHPQLFSLGLVAFWRIYWLISGFTVFFGLRFGSRSRTYHSSCYEWFLTQVLTELQFAVRAQVYIFCDH